MSLTHMNLTHCVTSCFSNALWRNRHWSLFLATRFRFPDKQHPRHRAAKAKVIDRQGNYNRLSLLMERQKATPPFGKDKFVQEDNTYLLVEVLAQKLAKQNCLALASNTAGTEPTVE